MVYYARTLFDLVKQTIENGEYTYHCMTNDIEINFQIINFEEDITINSAISYGNTIEDSQILILKFHKNLTITGSGVIIPQVRKKGMLIFVGDKLINQGKISMTARGASTSGQDIYLYKKDFVPAVGAIGGDKIGGVAGSSNGNPGITGINRETGGGGGGSRYSNYTAQYSGAGGSGTSYSGGAGGGGIACYLDTNPSYMAGDGSSTGGAGGDAWCRRTTANNHNATGGAGNPQGMNRIGTSVGTGSYVTGTSQKGTGGLLILYATSFDNQNTIESKGSNSGLNSSSNATTYCRPGGASGGGSINIYCKEIINEGTITAAGGIGAIGALTGGNGGNGSVTIVNNVEIPMLSQVIKDDVYHTMTEVLVEKPLTNVEIDNTDLDSVNESAFRTKLKQSIGTNVTT